MIDHDCKEACKVCCDAQEYGLCQECEENLPYVSMNRFGISVVNKDAKRVYEQLCQDCAWLCQDCQQNSVEELGDNDCIDCAWIVGNM